MGGGSLFLSSFITHIQASCLLEHPVTLLVSSQDLAFQQNLIQFVFLLTSCCSTRMIFWSLGSPFSLSNWWDLTQTSEKSNLLLEPRANRRGAVSRPCAWDTWYSPGRPHRRFCSPPVTLRSPVQKVGGQVPPLSR